MKQNRKIINNLILTTGLLPITLIPTNLNYITTPTNSDINYTTTLQNNSQNYTTTSNNVEFLDNNTPYLNQQLNNGLINDNIWNPNNNYNLPTDLEYKISGKYINIEGIEKQKYTNGNYLINNEIVSFLVDEFNILKSNESLDSFKNIKTMLSINDLYSHLIYNNTSYFNLTTENQTILNQYSKGVFENLIFLQQNISFDNNVSDNLFSGFYNIVNYYQNNIKQKDWYKNSVFYNANIDNQKSFFDKYYFIYFTFNQTITNINEIAVNFYADNTTNNYIFRNNNNLTTTDFDLEISYWILKNFFKLDVLFNPTFYSENFIDDSLLVVNNIDYNINNNSIPTIQYSIYTPNVFYKRKNTSISFQNSFSSVGLNDFSKITTHYSTFDNIINFNSFNQFLYNFYWIFSEKDFYLTTYDKNITPRYTNLTLTNNEYYFLKEHYSSQDGYFHFYLTHEYIDNMNNQEYIDWYNLVLKFMLDKGIDVVVNRLNNNINYQRHLFYMITYNKVSFSLYLDNPKNVSYNNLNFSYKTGRLEMFFYVAGNRSGDFNFYKSFINNYKRIDYGDTDNFKRTINKVNTDFMTNTYNYLGNNNKQSYLYNGLKPLGDEIDDFSNLNWIDNYKPANLNETIKQKSMEKYWLLFGIFWGGIAFAFISWIVYRLVKRHIDDKKSWSRVD